MEINQSRPLNSWRELSKGSLTPVSTERDVIVPHRVRKQAQSSTGRHPRRFQTRQLGFSRDLPSNRWRWRGAIPLAADINPLLWGFFTGRFEKGFSKGLSKVFKEVAKGRNFYFRHFIAYKQSRFVSWKTSIKIIFLDKVLLYSFITVVSKTGCHIFKLNRNNLIFAMRFLAMCSHASQNSSESRDSCFSLQWEDS